MKVRTAHLRMPPVRHPPFSDALRRQLIIIMDNFREVEVFNSTWSDYFTFEEGFRRDTHPEREIALWLLMSEGFRSAMDSGLYPPTAVEDLYRLTIAWSVNDATVAESPLPTLTPGQARSYLASLDAAWAAAKAGNTYYVDRHGPSWVVIRRANRSNGNIVCTHSSRQKARECCWARNGNPCYSSCED